MDFKGPILKFILIGLTVISLVFAGVFVHLYQNERLKAEKLQSQVDELTARERVLEDKLEASNKNVAELISKLQESKDRIASIGEELNKEKSTRQDALKELEQIKTEIEQQKFSRQDLESKLGKALAEGNKLKEQLQIINRQKDELEVKLKDLESASAGVELGKVVVNSESVEPYREGNASEAKKTDSSSPVSLKDKKQEGLSKNNLLEGRITVVNKEYNFVVINLGEKEGLNKGDQFSVYHEGKMIGDITVEKVHESMSAAGFAADLKNTIKENDIVIQKVK
ncbi:MAG: hypothetical protein PHT50_03630 [Candidatus Omnitrophica bacterium]|nr:hypothetical protein [Candidatus Omnitrophota bacterium]